MFSSGNIIEETLQVNYFDKPIDPIVTVRWRETPGSLDDRGLFPQTVSSASVVLA